jgi:chaperonin cofactor prefoldin
MNGGPSGGGGGGAARSGGSGGGGAAGGISEEDQKAVEEAENRVREVMRQKARASAQASAAAAEKRRAELTLAQLGPVPDDRALYRSVGRAFIRAPKADIVASLGGMSSRADKTGKVASATLEYLVKAEKEADGAFMEATAAIRRKLGRE